MSRSLRHPTHPACVCLWRNGESGRWTSPPAQAAHRPFLPNKPGPIPHSLPPGLTTILQDRPPPPGSHLTTRCHLRVSSRGRSWRSPRQLLLLSPPCNDSCSGGGETETWWARPTTGTGTLTCANTKHLLASPAHLHTPTTTMPTPLTLAEPRLPWELFLLQVPREPRCPGD